MLVWQRLRRLFHTRLRLLSSIALGSVVGFLMPHSLTPIQRAVIGWDCATAVFLALVIVMASRASPATMRRRAQLEDESRWVLLALMAGAAFFSMFAILGLMREAKSAGGNLAVMLTLLAALTIVLSWLLAHTMFA